MRCHNVVVSDRVAVIKHHPSSESDLVVVHYVWVSDSVVKDATYLTTDSLGETRGMAVAAGAALQRRDADAKLGLRRVWR